MNSENKSFTYRYSAKEQEELKKIREKYENREEDKMERIRRLDAGVTNTAQGVALIIGIVGTLILGLGMSFAISELGGIFGSHTTALLVGIPIGVFGGAVAALAYPVYNFLLKSRRKKIAPEILRLSDELMK